MCVLVNDFLKLEVLFVDYWILFQVFWDEKARRGVMRLWILRKAPELSEVSTLNEKVKVM